MCNYLYQKPIYNILKKKEHGELLVDKYLLFLLEKFDKDVKGIFDYFHYQYNYFIKTPVDFMGEDYILAEDIPDNYFILYHNTKKVASKDLYRVLTVRAYCRKVMKPYITVDELLFNIYIDNLRIAATPLHVGYCTNIVEHVYKATAIPQDIINRINAKIAADKPEVCIFRPGIKLEDRKKLMEEIVKNKISKVYDPKLTDKENAEKAGVCFNTFKKWAVENKKTKQDRIQQDIQYVREHYDNDLTIKKNFEDNPFIIEMNISFSTFKNIIKKMKQQDKETQPIKAPEQPEIAQAKQVTAEQPKSVQDEPKTSLETALMNLQNMSQDELTGFCPNIGNLGMTFNKNMSASLAL